MIAEDINTLFRVLTLSQVVVVTMYFLIFERHRLGYLIALTAMSFGAYLIMPMVFHAGFSWVWIPAIFATMIPSLLWLLGAWSFQERRDIPLWLVVVTLIYLTLTVGPEWSLPEPIGGVVYDLIPQVMKLTLVIHLIYMTLADHASDLVAARMRLRKPLAGGAGVLAATVIVVEIWSGDEVDNWIEALGAIVMFGLGLATCLMIFRSRLDLALAQTEAEMNDQVVVEAIDDFSQDVERITVAMQSDRLYALHGLTLGDLSEHLQIPVHRLRDAIHQGFGYGHFNQFLNHYRVDEASRRLLTEPSLPILTIALDVGFQSLSTFNKAFRDRHQCTPTAYRSR
ncbi:MAG: AraC family transcriptional regulator [Pseudomonadota bacterium]